MQSPRRLALSATLLSLGLLAGPVGCKRPRETAREQREARIDVAEARFDEAKVGLDGVYSSGVEAQTGAIDPSGKHGLLWAMERAQIAQLENDLSLSNELMAISSTIAEENRIKWTASNALEEVGTFGANDTVRTYDGAGYEHIQIDLIRGLNEILRAQSLSGLFAPSGYVFPEEPDPAHIEAGRRAMEQAISYFRRMTRKELLEVEYAAGRRRYDDDPFARLMAAAAISGHERATNSDRQFAHVMFSAALEAYGKERERLGGQKHWRYEVAPALDAVGKLYARNGIKYFGKQGFLDQTGGAMNAEALNLLAQPEGTGSVLFVDMHDYIARPEVLDIRFFSTSGDIPVPGPSIEDGRVTVSTFTVGGFGFYAMGPGSEIVNAWGAFPIPPRLADQLAPGGLAVMGFALPVHAPDEELFTAPTFSTQAIEGDHSTSTALQVAADIDAYARATLKDEQVPLLIKTMLLAFAKQAAVNLAAREAEKQAAAQWGGQAGALAGFATNLAGSAAMTATEIADTRAVSLLPNTYRIGLVDLPPGEHQIAIEKGGDSLNIGTVNVKEGSLIIVPVRTFSPRAQQGF